MNGSDLLEILRGACLFQCLSVGTIFLIKSYRSEKGIKYLAWFLLVGAFSFSIPLIFKTQIQIALILNGLSTVFFSPLLFLFCTSYSEKPKTSTTQKAALLTIPFIIVAGFIGAYSSNINALHRINLAVYLFNSALLILTYLTLYKNTHTREQASTWKKTKINWIMNMILYLILLNVTYYTTVVFMELDKTKAIYFANIHFLLTLVFLTGIIYSAMISPELMSNVDSIKSRLSNFPDLKYKYSDLTSEEARRIIEMLDREMKNRELYKDPNLTLENVSITVGKTSKDISQSINQYLDMNFKEFINLWRIRSAKEMLIKEEFYDLRVNEIMYEVGFNSKSTFNTLFKKHTGVTPKEFKRSRAGIA